MFNLQGSELIIILLLALVVLGPEKLPDAMRRAGQFYAELKKMSTGFQSEFRAAVDEPLRELRETANTIRDSADFTKLQNGERPEKAKSAEMVAAADPSDVPSTDLPFQPDSDDEADEPAIVEPPADVAPGDQEPFASVVLTNRAVVQPAAPDDPEATEQPQPPKAFSATQVSSAGPPSRVSKPVDPPTVGDEATAPDPDPDLQDSGVTARQGEGVGDGDLERSDDSESSE